MAILVNYFFLLANIHAIYIGVVSIEQQPDQQNTTIHIKVFQDDFEDAIRNEFGKHFLLKQNISNDSTSVLVASYFEKHLTIKINGIFQELKFESFEAINEIYLVTYTMNAFLDWSQFEIKADFLMELFPDQSNVIHLRHAQKPYYFRLTGADPIKTLIF